MKLEVKQIYTNLADTKKIVIKEEFLFDNAEISYTLKCGVTFMAKIENKGLSTYVAIVRMSDNKEGFEVVDSFEIALNKVFVYSINSSDIDLVCEFALKKQN